MIWLLWVLLAAVVWLFRRAMVDGDGQRARCDHLWISGVRLWCA